MCVCMVGWVGGCECVCMYVHLSVNVCVWCVYVCTHTCTCTCTIIMITRYHCDLENKSERYLGNIPRRWDSDYHEGKL